MKTLKLTSLIGALILVAGSDLIQATNSAALANPNSPAQEWTTPEMDAVVAFNATKALRHLASARKDIGQKNIDAAQRELGQALSVVGQMKSRFPAARMQELIAAARIRLTYQEPTKVLSYLELIHPTLADNSGPAAAGEIKRALARAEGFLKVSDKEAADRELAALIDILIYQSPVRPVALAEKHLLTAAAELDKQRSEIADRAIAASENNLNPIAFGMYSPLSETQKSLRQAALDNANGRAASAKASIERASRAMEQALKDAALKGRNEVGNLSGDIRSLVAKSTQSGERLGSDIMAVWQRGESLGERALDYRTASVEKFQASRADANDLIEAKLHVAFAEIYEFTTGETQKSATELDQAAAYLKKAAPLLKASEKATMDRVNTDLRQVQGQLGKNQSGQRQRYLTIEDTLSQLIH